ncbi:MAG: HlyC/CorC family transporter [Bacteroidaceae bacterium]|nr:HlyC/CorC family transporter [Bacteroidaceae bacterium]
MTFIFLLISMLFSAYFSGMEIAFVSSNKMRFEMEKSEHNGVINNILSMFFRHSNNFISTMLVGNNIALVVYGILAAHIINSTLLHPLFGQNLNEFLEITIQTLLSTLIILVTGEFIPKTLFKISPNRTLRVFAIPTFIIYIILYPISRFSTLISGFLLRIFGTKISKDSKGKAFTKVDLDNLIQSSIEENKEEDVEDEVKIFQNALDFSNVKIRDCILPRTEITAVPDTADLQELEAKFIESGHSKLIVYQDNIDHIIGYIHSSEMFRKPEDWRNSIRQIPIVPETMAATKLMRLFMQQKKSLAVVVDEFGGTSGIVSLEDLVEEITGDIEDEHDNTTYIAKEIGENEYIISARLEIEKVNEMLNLDLPESEEYLTVGGLLLHQYQSFPKLHEIIRFDKFRFKIIKVAATKIELVRLKVTD